MGFTVEILNADSLIKKLGNIEDIDITPAVDVTTQAVANKAYELVRKDTGTLANSIMPEVLQLIIGGKKTPVGRVSTPVEYGIWNEIGTSRMPAQPFMKPAVNEEKQPFVNRVKALQRTQITKIAKK